jgi:hypothetical protein
MKIVNLSNPDQEPVNGDFVRYEYENGTFLEKQYWKQREFTEEEKLEAKKQDERERRDQELINTDWIVPVVDHPKHSAYMTYRQELRDYPSQPDFPNGTRPLKP